MAAEARDLEREGQHERMRNIPPRFAPFMRLGLVAAVVLLADALTARVVDRGLVLHPAAVTALRILSAAGVLRYPLAGFVLAIEVDKWDWFWLGMPSRPPGEQALYQEWDKLMDVVMLSAGVLVAFHWEDRRARILALATYAWRVFGVALFTLTGARWLLIAFPNVFESMFLLYVVFHVLTRRTEMLASRQAAALVLAALALPKVGQEVFLHLLEDRPWRMFTLLAPGVDAWLWGAGLLLPPVIALLVLVRMSEGRATRGDPEVEVSALPDAEAGAGKAG